MKRIKYVQLEPAAVLTDIEWQKMTAQERGVYWQIILTLYCHNGKINYDISTLKMICNCENFEKVWEKIEKHFQIKNNFLRHSRVSKELREAKRRLQVAKDSGLRGARKRWAGYSNPNGDPIAKERKETESEGKVNKGKENEGKVRKEKTGDLHSTKIQQPQKKSVKDFDSPRSSSSVSSLSSCLSSISSRLEPPDGTLASKILRFYDCLCEVIVPRSQSDKTAFRNIGNWLKMKILTGKFNEDIFERVLDYAEQAAGDTSRKPAAVFTAILKDKLNYKT